MNTNFKKGDKVRIMYWNELPIHGKSRWNPLFFKKHGGKTGTVTDYNGKEVTIKFDEEVKPFGFKKSMSSQIITDISLSFDY